MFTAFTYVLCYSRLNFYKVLAQISFFLLFCLGISSSVFDPTNIIIDNHYYSFAHTFYTHTLRGSNVDRIKQKKNSHTTYFIGNSSSSSSLLVSIYLMVAGGRIPSTGVSFWFEMNPVTQLLSCVCVSTALWLAPFLNPKG